MRNREAHEHRSTAFVIITILILWEVVGQFRLVALGALPAPSAILTRLWIDRGDYALHTWSTIRVAAVGFVFGNVIAIVAALLFVRLPLTERLARGINIAIFALPPIAIVPVLVIALPGEGARLAPVTLDATSAARA